MFLHNLLNVLVQIANKTDYKKKVVGVVWERSVKLVARCIKSGFETDVTKGIQIDRYSSDRSANTKKE
jgi:hypothetical protein